MCRCIYLFIISVDFIRSGHCGRLCMCVYGINVHIDGAAFVACSIDNDELKSVLSYLAVRLTVYAVVLLLRLACFAVSVRDIFW